ncbi:MAG: hypothetical protein QXJ62_02205 [Nitrososphaeria archaeon]
MNYFTKKTGYKATKLPIEIFGEAELAKAKLTMNMEALRKIPQEIVNPTDCPICGEKLKISEARVRVKIVSCGRCGYKQPSLDVTAIGNDPATFVGALGLGILAGLGIAALLYLAFGGEGK